MEVFKRKPLAEQLKEAQDILSGQSGFSQEEGLQAIEKLALYGHNICLSMGDPREIRLTTQQIKNAACCLARFEKENPEDAEPLCAAFNGSLDDIGKVFFTVHNDLSISNETYTDDEAETLLKERDLQVFGSPQTRI